MTRRRFYFKMVAGSLVRRRSRMLVALLAVAIGATVLSGLVAIYRDVPRQMGQEFRSYGANLLLLPAEGGTLRTADIAAAAALIPAGARVGVSPVRYETVRVNNLPFVAAGVDFAEVRHVSPYWYVSGAFPAGTGAEDFGTGAESARPESAGDGAAHADADDSTIAKVGGADSADSGGAAIARARGAGARREVLLGQSVAAAVALGTGDVVLVQGTDAGGAAFSAEFTVAGILQTGGSEEECIYMALGDLERLMGTSGTADAAECSVSASGAELEAVAAAIGAGVPGVRARLVKRVAKSEGAVLAKLQSLVWIVTLVVLVLTMVCVATTMTAVVAERRKEIALKKALGAAKGDIVLDFLGEGLFLGAVGGVLGSALGFFFAQSVSVNVFGRGVSFQPLLVPATVLVSVAVTGAACLLPVRSATDVDPALVLKGE